MSAMRSARLSVVSGVEQRHSSLGAHLELTGPWPTCTSPRHDERGGAVIAGEITLAVADVDLVHVSLRALISSVASLEESVVP
jgi:hypothetical protein